jgi:Tubulin like
MANKLYVVAIGGSGARCVEAIAHMAASGLYSSEQIEVLIIDPDENNGNVDRTRKTMSLYQDCQQMIGSTISGQAGEWMSTPIRFHGLWSPFQDDDKAWMRQLSSYFSYASMRNSAPPLANLLDTLYTPDERIQNLDEGFRGRPSIGAAVMSQIDLKDLNLKPWSEFIQSINAAITSGKDARILMCGSIFGGTGASGVPTIARLLRNKLENENLISKVKIGGLFLLPYFGFAVPPGADTQGLYASADQFLLNTEAALRYYVTQASQLFDTVYVLGNENTAQVEFSVGNKSQKNPPHFVELYAALAARDFLFQNRDDGLMAIARESLGTIRWEDLPDTAIVKRSMANTTRLAYLWLSDIENDLNEARRMGAKALNVMTWLKNYYPQNDTKLDDPNQEPTIRAISNWSRNYLEWIRDLHTCGTDSIRLFNTQSLGNLDGAVQRDQLSNLVLGDIREPNNKIKQDRISDIKERMRVQDIRNVQGINKGTIGLAKSLYLNSQIS